MPGARVVTSLILVDDEGEEDVNHPRVSPEGVLLAVMPLRFVVVLPHAINILDCDNAGEDAVAAGLTIMVMMFEYTGPHEPCITSAR